MKKYSLKRVVISQLFLIGIALMSCGQQKEKTFSDMVYSCTFQKEERGILSCSIEHYDIKPEVSLNIKEGYSTICGVNFAFYNYGDGLCIANQCRNDIFIRNIAPQVYFIPLEDHHIRNIERLTSNTYGIYGKASIVNSQVAAQDVIVSPLAANFILNRSYNDDGHLIYVRVVYGEMYNDYVFLGNYETEEIIKNHYHLINTNPALYTTPSGDIKKM